LVSIKFGASQHTLLRDTELEPVMPGRHTARSSITEQLSDLKDGGHLLLLREGAVVLDGEYEGEGGGDEGAPLDDLDDLEEGDLGGEGVTVEDDRQAVLSVPAVQLHTPAP